MSPQRIPAAQRKRLERNRQGRLAGAQWLATVTQPLSVLLVLLAPLVIILGPRLAAFSLRGFALVALLVLLLLLLPALWRARRYARAPLEFAELQRDSNPVAGLFFWRPLVMRAANGEEFRFQRRLTPIPRLRSGQTCLVYFLRDGEQRVLLSLVSADHPEARHYRPTDAFQRRAQQRT
ncbi:MAG: hypothetical protein OXF44_01735 [Anaerolineaceae bacterium]|nr:hypothetical protein [Anaerolineaceae bacterium]